MAIGCDRRVLFGRGRRYAAKSKPLCNTTASESPVVMRPRMRDPRPAASASRLLDINATIAKEYVTRVRACRNFTHTRPAAAQRDSQTQSAGTQCQRGKDVSRLGGTCTGGRADATRWADLGSLFLPLCAARIGSRRRRSAGSRRSQQAGRQRGQGARADATSPGDSARQHSRGRASPARACAVRTASAAWAIRSRAQPANAAVHRRAAQRASFVVARARQNHSQ